MCKFSELFHLINIHRVEKCFSHTAVAEESCDVSLSRPLSQDCASKYITTIYTALLVSETVEKASSSSHKNRFPTHLRATKTFAVTTTSYNRYIMNHVAFWCFDAPKNCNLAFNLVIRNVSFLSFCLFTRKGMSGWHADMVSFGYQSFATVPVMTLKSCAWGT